MMKLGTPGIMIRKCYLTTKLGGQATLEAVGVNNYLSGMPAFEELLSDVEIWEILSYIRSTWPEHIQEAHATRHPIKIEE